MINRQNRKKILTIQKRTEGKRTKEKSPLGDGLQDFRLTEINHIFIVSHKAEKVKE